MGVTASKPTETKVFSPSSNVEYGQSLMNNLAQSNETDYARSQYSEIGFQKEVSKKLDSLSEESNKFFDTTLQKSQLTEDTGEDKNLSNVKLNDKINELTKSLESKNNKFLTLNENVLNSKKEIVNCLIKNKSTPLNCWDEVKNFEKLVNEL